jgi:hypothetical protein
LGFNNPLDEVWLEAQDIWTPNDGRLEQHIQCVVSIGTGRPGTSAVGDKRWTIAITRKDIATQTEMTERSFAMRHRQLFEPEQRYYRFNVDQGLENVGLGEHDRVSDMVDATAKYLDDHERVRREFRKCAAILREERSLSSKA